MPGSSGQAFRLRAVMKPFSPGGAGTPALNMNPCYDSSPSFAEAPISVICSGYTYTYSHNAADVDLDEMEYSLTAPLGTSGNPIASTGGYSWTLNPGTGPFPSSPGMQFNTVTGNITISPQIGGGYASAVKVETRRCGQVIAEVYRDIPIIIRTGCPSIPQTGSGTTNLPPTVVIQNYAGFDTVKPVYAANGSVAYWKVSVFAGEKVKFGMVATETQLLPTFAPQLIDCKPLGQQLGSPLNNANAGCINPPCATIVAKPGQPGLIGIPTVNEVVFEWQTDCGHLASTLNSCGQLSNVYPFLLRMADNFCPVPASQTVNVIVEVINSMPDAPDLSASCVTRLPNGQNSINWSTPLDTGQNFDAYVVYYGTNPAVPFVAVDTVFGYNTSTFTHTNPAAGQPAYYYMRTLGGCGLTSATSDTISLIELDVTPFPPTNSYVAQLAWNAGHTGTGWTYEVWRRGTTSPWTQIGSTTNLAYNDTVNLCGDLLRYEIRVAGSCNSTRDSGQFSDQVNTDAMALDSVSVQGPNAVLSWQPSKSGDIVNYIVLRGNGATWTPLATVPAGQPMPYVIPGLDPNTTIGLYKVISVDSCGNQSSDLLVPYHNNMLLNENIDPCEAILRLTWNAYLGWPGGVSKYQVLADVTPPGGPTQIGVLLATLPGNPNPSPGSFVTYSSRDVISGYSYCYYVRAVDTSGTLHSTSNQKCINGLVVNNSDLLYIARTTVRSDKAIDLVLFLDKMADVIYYDVQRADDPSMPFISLGKLPKPSAGIGEIRFTDFTGDASNHRYVYRFVSTDSCGKVDTISNIATTIFLHVTPQDNLVNKLVWSKYRDFGGKVKEYRIYRDLNEYGTFNDLVGVVSSKDSIFYDRILDLGASVSGIFCYKVVAVEENNPLMFIDIDNAPFRSTSNVGCAEYSSRVFMSNAFNPNSSITENKIWRPLSIYTDVTTYSLEIFNRWGTKVYETADKNAGWDGLINGQDAPVGVYMYRLRYKSIQGDSKDIQGSLTLLR
jgi:gliding motility-associated-like protein